MTIIRLLGGSHHGKRMEIPGNPPSIFLMKRPKIKKWSPNDLMLNSPYTTIEQEKYEKKYVRNITATSPGKWLVETKVAYVKAGSKVKDETFWKLGLQHETRIEDYGRSNFFNAKKKI